MNPDDELEGLGGEPDEEALPPIKRGYITRVGAERLHQELQRLVFEDRPRITAEVSAAAAQGDRSENAEYLYGKKKLREIDRRIRFLQKRLESLTVVDPKEQKDRSRVYFGATVTLEDEDGKHTTYRIVGADEIDPKGGCISLDSPVGRALLRKELNETITVQRPRGEIELTIVSIDYV